MKRKNKDKRLYSPKYLKEILSDNDFYFSKSLGQNFLIDGNVVRNIVKASNISKNDLVLEIGPGVGTLTEELSLNARKVIAVEIDNKLIPILSETLSDYKNIEIINEDILKLDIKNEIIKPNKAKNLKVVANLPYYITTPIIGKLLEENRNIDSITVMVQKEIAERMIAKPGNKDYGALSIFINFYSNPNIEFIVPNTVFMPRPKVDSAIVKLDVKEKIIDIDEELFFDLIKGSFFTRRKTIANSLSNYKFKNMKKREIVDLLKRSDIDPGIRAEDLSIDDFIRIIKELNG